MRKVFVMNMGSDFLTFSNGMMLSSFHDRDCCESHYLSFDDLTLADFKGLEFDIDSDDFFERIKGYGIALIPLVGHPVRIPWYGFNNGFYSSDLSLTLENADGSIRKKFDITECQTIEDS